MMNLKRPEDIKVRRYRTSAQNAPDESPRDSRFLTILGLLIPLRLVVERSSHRLIERPAIESVNNRGVRIS